MKRKIIYTLILVCCTGLYATSKEFSATGKQGEIAKQVTVPMIKQKPCSEEIAQLAPLVNIFLQV